jgi:hypothetical protein
VRWPNCVYYFVNDHESHVPTLRFKFGPLGLRLNSVWETLEVKFLGMPHDDLIVYAEIWTKDQALIIIDLYIVGFDNR